MDNLPQLPCELWSMIIDFSYYSVFDRRTGCYSLNQLSLLVDRFNPPKHTTGEIIDFDTFTLPHADGSTFRFNFNDKFEDRLRITRPHLYVRRTWMEQLGIGQKVVKLGLQTNKRTGCLSKSISVPRFGDVVERIEIDGYDGPVRITINVDNVVLHFPSTRHLAMCILDIPIISLSMIKIVLHLDELDESVDEPTIYVKYMFLDVEPRRFFVKGRFVMDIPSFNKNERMYVYHHCTLSEESAERI